MSASALEVFSKALADDTSTGIATIQGLLSVLSSSSATTVQELVHNLRSASEQFRKVDCSCIAVKSTSDLFTLFITQKEHARLEREDFESCRRLMIARGATFLARLQESKAKIASVCQPFLAEGSVVLVHGNSKVVLAALTMAATTRHMVVMVTRASGDMKKKLEAEGLNCELVEDMGVGVAMHKADCVLLGAEGVVETGGVVNQLGSYTVATVARALGKPTYVMAESFKFVREYPLGQEDLPAEYLYHASVLAKHGDCLPAPRVDYTPPSLITLLFTDLGILTPSAVSDELINLYL